MSESKHQVSCLKVISFFSVIFYIIFRALFSEPPLDQDVCFPGFSLQCKRRFSPKLRLKVLKKVF